MRIPNRLVDIEFTNRCNATCDFCPREKTPKQGFMSRADFMHTLARIDELGDIGRVTITGLGEPMLHPNFIEFMQLALSKNLPVDLTTNGSRLFPEKTDQLLEAGLPIINFSISDLDEDYRKVYGLKFEQVLPNIQYFIQKSRGKCHVKISIVAHQGNRDKVDIIKQFWVDQGADEINIFVEDNRGGAHEMDYSFLHSRKYLRKSIEILREKLGSELCGYSPYGVFVGWDGRYYLCCNDWEKTVPVGHVSTHGFEEVVQEKIAFNRKQTGVCRTCNRNPVNEIQNVLLEMDAGLRGPRAIANKLNSLRISHQLDNWLPYYLDQAGEQEPHVIVSSSETP